RGSRLSVTTPGRLAAKLVGLPRDLLRTAKELMPAELTGEVTREPVPSSIDLLSPDAPALQVLAARPRPVGVHFHSIIGRAPPRTVRREITRPFLGNEPTDGAVPYSSAHLEAAESEIVVAADHFSVHHHPLAVREVRRILLEHLRDIAAWERSVMLQD